MKIRGYNVACMNDEMHVIYCPDFTFLQITDKERSSFSIYDL